MPITHAQQKQLAMQWKRAAPLLAVRALQMTSAGRIRHGRSMHWTRFSSCHQNPTTSRHFRIRKDVRDSEAIKRLMPMHGLFKSASQIQKLLDKQRWKYCFIGGLAVQKWGQVRVTKDVRISDAVDWIWQGGRIHRQAAEPF